MVADSFSMQAKQALMLARSSPIAGETNPVVCTNDSARCEGNQIQRCVNNAWVDSDDCGARSQQCVALETVQCIGTDITVTNIIDYSETTTPTGNCVIGNDSDISTHGTLVDAVSYGGTDWGIDTINGVHFVKVPALGDGPLPTHISIGMGGANQVTGDFNSPEAPFSGLSPEYRAMLSKATYRESGFKSYFSVRTRPGEAYEIQLWINDSTYVGNYADSLVTLKADRVFRYLQGGNYVTTDQMRISKNNSGRQGGLGTFLTAIFLADSDILRIEVLGFGHINGAQIRRLTRNSPPSAASLHFNDTSVADGPTPSDWDILEEGQENDHGSNDYLGYTIEEQGSVQPLISTDIVREGSGALFMQLNPATTALNQRTEVTVQSDDANEYALYQGREKYFGFSFMMEPGFPDPIGWFNIHQTKLRRSPYQTNSNIPFIQFGFYTDDGVLSFSSNGTAKLPMFRPERGVWYDVVIGWRFATVEPNGFIYCWIKERTESTYTRYGRDNVRVGYTDRYHSSYAYNFGMYKLSEQKTYRMYFDAVKTGETFEDVRIE